jgi:soluble lytic murein transglycosylase
MKMNKQHNSVPHLKIKLNNKKILQRSFVVGGLLACSSVYALDDQFNDALRAANAGNTALLDQYQYEMQNDVLGYYPEYWKLNSNLGFQPASSIINFAQRYPKSAMAEKLAADYVEEKVKQANFSEAKPVLSYVTNPDQDESCAVAQVRAQTGDSLVYAEYKDIWLATNTQPESCNGLGRMMLSSP